MAHFHNNALIGASGQGGYQIERSLRFNSADSAYLNRTAGTPTDNKKWTWSAWAKISGASQALNFASSASGTSMYFGLETSQGDNFIMQIAGTRVYKSTAIFRDPSAWYHFVFVFDSANGTQADRSILYINGVRQAATTASVTLNQTTGFNAASTAMNIGYSNAWTATSSDYFSGYLTEVHFIDGQALTPSSFGETDTITGVWKPKKYAGTYGTNGFYLKFADNSGTTSTTLGKDSSGNGNNWTPNNFSVTAGAGNDSLIDTPTPYADGGNGRGNYATLNPLNQGSQITLSNGNLDYSHTGSTVSCQARSTIAMTSGKWYCEHTTNSGGTYADVGIVSAAEAPNSGYLGQSSTSYGYYALNGNKYNNSVGTSYGATYTDGDVVGIAFDADNGTLTFYKNGVSQGTAFNSIPAGTYLFAQGNYPASVTYAGSFNFGQRAFAYTPPSGFKALNTQNLPEPTIKKPSSYMDVVLYTGNGSALTPTSSLGFSPDLVWIKGRSGATDHALYDTVRGTEKRLESNTEDAEVTSDGGVTAFNSFGFTLGTLAQVNTNTATYCAWCWDESATPGFDIVTYTGNGSSQNVSHSLGVSPSFIVVKTRSAVTNWLAWHSTFASTDYIGFNLTSAKNYAGSLSTVFTGVSSTTFSIGSNTTINNNSATYVAYLWSEVAGFSKFGSYSGTGSSDGPFVFLGFRPKFVMFKRSDSTGSWFLEDSARGTYNVMGPELYANLSDAESTVNRLDFLSNGFKLRAANPGDNASGGTYIYAAFAETPFRYSLAR